MWKPHWAMLKIGPKKLWGALEDQKRARSKNFWCNLGKALGPPSAHPRNFLIHAQSWLKSAVQFPLNRNFTSPKLPPLGAKRVFLISGYLGVMYCPPWPSLVQIWQPPSVRSVSLTAGIPNKGVGTTLANLLCSFSKPVHTISSHHIVCADGLAHS